MRPTRHAEEKGSVLLAAIILAMLFVALITWASNWMTNTGRTQVSQVAAQRALQYADSGVNSVMPWLKLASLSQNLPPGTTSGLSVSLPNGRADMSLTRTSSDQSLVDVYATGYYFLNAAPRIDSATGKHAQMAVINAKFRIANVSEYLMAVPGTLDIAPGLNVCPGGVCRGILYGSSIQFDVPTSPGVPPAQVGMAYYYTPGGVTYANATVVFNAGPPQQLSYAPSFAVLDPKMQTLYTQMVSSGAVNPAFEGTVASPPLHVYVVDGDADIGSLTQPLVVQGVYVIYVKGTAKIHNNILLADSASWIGILAENDIRIAADAPDDITLNGNFVCNGLFTAEPVLSNTPSLHSAPSQMTVYGGIVTMSQITPSNGYANRSYNYKTSNDPNLFLPNIADLLQYTFRNNTK